MSDVQLEDTINPEDSVSHCGDGVAKSVASSSTSSASRLHAKTKARRAALVAEAEGLRRLQELELEELKLKQKRSLLKLQTQLEVTKAEEDVYSGLCEEERSHVSRHKSSVDPPPATASNVQDDHDQDATIPYPTPPSRPAQNGGQAVDSSDVLHQNRRLIDAVSLRNAELMKFNGNPLHYFEFMRSFDNLIGESALDDGTKLIKLFQCCEGEAKGIIQCCMVMVPHHGYQRARELLEERFGSRHKIADAWMKQVTGGPPFHASDKKGLQKFSDQLKTCVETLNALSLTREMSSQRELLKVVDRLPFYLKGRWLKVVQDIRHKGGCPDITDVVKFVSAAAEEVNDPVFGEITVQSKSDAAKPNFKKQQNNKSSYSTVATGKATSMTQQPKKCIKCKQEHTLFGCDKFKAMTPEQRFEFAKDNKLCFNCLQPGHSSRYCRLNRRCSVTGCHRKHTKFLHTQEDAPSAARNLSQAEDEPSSDSTQAHTSQAAQNGFIRKGSSGTRRCVLPIVPVRVWAQGKTAAVQTYALLDSGSTSTFCTDRLAKQINADSKKESLNLTTLEKVNSRVRTSVVSLLIDSGQGTEVVKLPCVYTRESINIQQTNIAKVEDVEGWEHLQGIDIPLVTQHEVGLLIGQDIPEALIPLEVRRGHKGPYAVRTKLGWSVSGPVSKASEHLHSATANFIGSDVQLEEQVHKFWQMEGSEMLQTQKGMSINDKKVLSLWEGTVKLQDGHFQLPIPYKEETSILPDNRWAAEQRLKSLRRRLVKDGALHDKYRQGITDLLEKNYAEEVNEETRGTSPSKDDHKWYLPHHPVMSPQKPGKVRIVFDCAAKHQEVSLNDIVSQGPDLTNNLLGVLLRFRQHPVALMADIEAMFYQVKVPAGQQDALRFLWWKDGDLDAALSVYRMCVHPFGGTWSPSACGFALRQIARHSQDEVAKTILHNFYVDDCLVSVESENSAKKLAADLTLMLKGGGFRLTKWISNSPAVLQSIPEVERAKDVKGLDINHDALPVERALGISWDVESDCLLYKCQPKSKPQTRRGILSVVSSIYDPLGYVSPFVLQAKLILQELTRLKLGWDETIPDAEKENWNKWLRDLPTMAEFEVNRCVIPHDFGQVVECELHHFADASEVAYGAVSYLVSKNADGEVHSGLILAKSHLAPLKKLTIPRLELTAATVSVKLDAKLKAELELPIKRSVYWTDSTIVLQYIRNEDKRFNTYVANRVTAIRDQSDPGQWHHVNSHDNPADDVTRGMGAKELKANTRWLTGPKFIQEDENVWPKDASTPGTIAEDDPEVKRKKDTQVFATEASQSDAVDRLLNYHSTWYKLQRAVAWMLRLKQFLRGKSQGNTSYAKGPLSTGDIAGAEEAIVKYVQLQTYAKEYMILEGDQSTQARTPRRIAKSSPLYKLNAKLTDEGLICVGGRLDNAPLEERAKHPVIMPPNHHVVQLLVRHYHIMSGHSGKEYVLSLIRQRYWVIRGRLAVRRVLSDCFICKRLRAGPVEQKMADLPADRVAAEKPPFSHVGVDCFGPYMVKQGRSLVKRYGCIFTCLVIRAIHIEVLHSLDTDSFLNALQRFISRRGRPEIIRSDNGTNFIGAEREPREGLKRWNQGKIHDHLLQQGINWRFNPPTASHMGGAWERQIRTTRKVLNAVVKQQTLNDEGLVTLMCLVESIVNGRPLTVTSDDVHDAEPLTPNHLLLLRPSNVLPPDVFQQTDLYSRRRWRQIQYLADVFWRRWVREYLPSLQQRQKWQEVARNLQLGDLVLIVDDQPRNKWLMGRVMETFPGKDNLVRSVRVKHSRGILERPVTKLCLLEAAGSGVQ
ncbi:uncharacterized protein [Diadema setosum]|uniref:uncharacterized protein n=1 Tax=Diadema setosum TaxID=31175 RepID=UPI003B3B0F7B